MGGRSYRCGLTEAAGGLPDGSAADSRQPDRREGKPQGARRGGAATGRPQGRAFAGLGRAWALPRERTPVWGAFASPGGPPRQRDAPKTIAGRARGCGCLFLPVPQPRGRPDAARAYARRGWLMNVGGAGWMRDGARYKPAMQRGNYRAKRATNER